MIRFANNVSTTLVSALDEETTVFDVANASKFPDLDEGDVTYCTIIDAYNAQWLEICEVQSFDGNTLTVRRGIEDTTPLKFNANSKVELRLTAEMLTRAIQEAQFDFIDGNITVIQLKRDDADGFDPALNPNALEIGELVFNTTTGDLYSKRDDNTVIQLGGSDFITDDAPHGGPTIYGRRNGEWAAIPFPSTFVADLPPTILDPETNEPVEMPTGSMWYDTGTTSELYVFDGQHWVSMTGVDSGAPEGGALADNVVIDDFLPENEGKTLGRIHPADGKGYWKPITTSDIGTEPEATFRDSKGRFKSTKGFEDLTDQLKVNRFFATEFEGTNETIANEAEMRRTKDDQLQLEIVALAKVVEEINVEGADTAYVDERVAAEGEVRRKADEGLQSEINILAETVAAIDIPEIPEIPDVEGLATEEYVKEKVATEGEVRRKADEGLQSEINTLAETVAAIEVPDVPDNVATEEYVNSKVADEAEIRGLQDDRIETKVTNLAESLSDEAKAREQGDVNVETNANSYTDEQIGAESSARRTADEGLQNEVEALAEALANVSAYASVIVSDDPPSIEADGQLWYDSNRLELFVSYQDAWISTSPLESRIEAGEALQAQILGRVEAGEIKQATIESEYLNKKGGTSNKMKGNLYMGGFFIAGLEEPTANDHAATMQYVDKQVASIGQASALDPYASNFIMPGYGLTGAGELVGGEGVFKFVRMDGAGFTANPKDSRGICFDIHKYSSFFGDLRTKLDTGTCYGTGIIYVWDETLSNETALIAKYRVTNKGDYDTQGNGSFFIYGDQLMARSDVSTTHTYRIELVGF